MHKNVKRRAMDQSLGLTCQILLTLHYSDLDHSCLSDDLLCVE